MTDERAHQLSRLIGKFAEATAAHQQAQAMAEQATALDRALELEAAEHGIGFDEIVFEVLKKEQCQ